SITAEIKQKALQVGFSKVGCVRAEILSDQEARLREWLARGYHGEMKWMERDPEQRADPRRLFPDVRSVVVVAMNYYTPHEHWVSGAGRTQEAPLTGKVSRY